jgi:hypothetical protein
MRLSACDGSKSPVPPSSREATCDYTDNEQEYDRSHGGDNNFADDPGTNVNAQPRKQPTAKQTSYNPKGDVANESKTATGHDSC